MGWVRVVLAVTFVVDLAAGGAELELGTNRHLFLDDALLDSTENAELTVNPPTEIDLVVIADRPWEAGGITSYGNVLYDPEREEYRLYYVPVCWDVDPGFCLALATSKDGRYWEKPSLGVVEWKGSKDNNIVIWGQREGTVIIDPNAPPERRYAIVSSNPDLKTRLFTSPDGVHFTMDEQLMSSLHSDSQISTFWDPDKQVYFHCPRLIVDGLRATGVLTTERMDEPWPEDIQIAMTRDDRDAPELDLYTNACQKYPIAPNHYVGLPTPYYHYNAEGRSYLNQPTLDIGGKTNDGTIETQLAVSRDGFTWKRYRTPYFALGNYDGLDVKIAHGIPGLLFRDDVIYQYFMGYTFTHGDTQIRYGDGGRELGGVFLAEQRIDGFVSLDFAYEGGTATTKPFTFDGHRLILNLNTSASGQAQVAILDADGNEIPGFGLAESRIINGDYIEKTATWSDGSWDISELAGEPVRLRFICRGTKLYSFRFARAGQEAPYEVVRAADEPVPAFNTPTLPAQEPVDVRIGPHLFIDDYLISELENIIRTTHSPQRVAENPILGWEAGTTQPYVTVLYDPQARKYRMWYNRDIGRECTIAYAESDDGVQWTTPSLGILGDDNRLLKISAPFQNGYGVSVIDEGPAYADKNMRYKVAWWGQAAPWPDGDPGMRVAFSPDGLNWTPYEGNPVLPDFGEAWFLEDPRRPYGVGDIIDVFYDPLRGHYSALFKTPALPVDGYEAGPRANTYIRRLVSQSMSDDFVHWERPWRIAIPEERDADLLEFYSIGGTIARGGLLIGFVRMLHDDYPTDPGGAAEGIGYTTLITSRDGMHWQRHEGVFFDRAAEPDAWDHAMTWVGCALPVKDELYLYYGGYQRGHKVEPTKERQLGLATMPRDRFVSRDSVPGVTGRIVTAPLAHVKEAGPTLYLNAAARSGTIRVTVLDELGMPMRGAVAEVSGDDLKLSVSGLRFSEIDAFAPISLQFELTDAQLFGFEFGE